MITKDVVESHIDKVDVEISSDDEQNSVDAIFADADEQMTTQKKQLNEEPKQKRKKMRWWKKALITLGVIIALIVFISYKLVDYTIDSLYPTIKETCIAKFEESKERLGNTDDSELTIDQYYQKQLVLLFTTEDLERMFDSMTSIDKMMTIFSGEGEVDVSVLSEEKRQEYERIMAEYEAALASAETEQEDTETE